MPPLRPARQPAPAGRRRSAAVAAAVLLVGIAGAALAGIVLARTQPSSARSQRRAAALRVASTVERAGQGVLDLLTAERAAVTAVPAPSPATFAGWSVRLGAFARLPGLALAAPPLFADRFHFRGLTALNLRRTATV